MLSTSPKLCHVAMMQNHNQWAQHVTQPFQFTFIRKDHRNTWFCNTQSVKGLCNTPNVSGYDTFLLWLLIHEVYCLGVKKSRIYSSFTNPKLLTQCNLWTKFVFTWSFSVDLCMILYNTLIYQNRPSKYSYYIQFVSEMKHLK